MHFRNRIRGGVRGVPLCAVLLCLCYGTLAAQSRRAQGVDTVRIEDGRWLGRQNPGVLFYRIAGAVMLEPGRVVVANGGMRQYHVFDVATQRLLATGGREGGGPGEFRDMRSIVAAERRRAAIILDGRQRRLTTVSPAGDVTATRRMPEVPSLYQPSLFGVLEDGRLVMSQTQTMFALAADGPERIERNPLDVFLVDTTSGVAVRLLRTEGREMAITRLSDGRYGSTPREFGSTAGIGVLLNKVVVVDGEDGRVAVNGPDGTAITWLAEPLNRRISSADVAASRQRAAMALSERRREAFLRLLERSPPVRERLPEFGDEVVPEGSTTFWVGRYTGPQDNWRTWEKYSIDGELQHSIYVSTEAVLVDAHGSWLLFVVRGDESEDVVLFRRADVRQTLQ